MLMMCGVEPATFRFKVESINKKLQYYCFYKNSAFGARFFLSADLYILINFSLIIFFCRRVLEWFIVYELPWPFFLTSWYCAKTGNPFYVTALFVLQVFKWMVFRNTHDQWPGRTIFWPLLWILPLLGNPPIQDYPFLSLKIASTEMS